MLRRRAIKELLLIGSSVAAAGSLIAGWKYHQLNEAPDWHSFQLHQDLLAELTETILPATDTVGAKAAGVPAFVQHMVQKGLDVKSQNNFINGLKEVSDYCQSHFGKSFMQITPDEKVQTLTYFEHRTHSLNSFVAKAQTRLIGKPFFSILRDFTLIGYCTSELGATQGLAYDYLPGTYVSCLPYVKGQKSWATQ